MITEQQVLDALRHVLDGDVPANVVDLGLVQKVVVEGDTVRVRVGMLSPDPRVRAEEAEDIRREVQRRTGAAQVEIEPVPNPHWVPEMMNDAARLALSARADEG